ncbi:MAG: STAS domain-containing protein [Verrucomicrobia bacterium]|nr:STAS domain-containing protein [Verrucomicrobiota bacterium]MBU6446217.1 STAS domain-containing protein [Verrucomicrobiota bacterium]MDE3047150.1 STAS domain-containing protein [Verrucomicrobiota bacterium]
MGVGLRIDLEEIEHRVIVRLSGRLDVASSPLLERKLSGLIAEEHTHLLLDFSRIDYLSSAGMRVLLAAQKKLTSKKGELILFALTDEVSEVIKMAGFDKILRICSSEKEALQFHK